MCTHTNVFINVCVRIQMCADLPCVLACMYRCTYPHICGCMCVYIDLSEYAAHLHVFTFVCLVFFIFINGEHYHSSSTYPVLGMSITVISGL